MYSSATERPHTTECPKQVLRVQQFNWYSVSYCQKKWEGLREQNDVEERWSWCPWELENILTPAIGMFNELTGFIFRKLRIKPIPVRHQGQMRTIHWMYLLVYSQAANCCLYIRIWRIQTLRMRPSGTSQDTASGQARTATFHNMKSPRKRTLLSPFPRIWARYERKFWCVSQVSARFKHWLQNNHASYRNPC
jgi:hypothetical protein